MKFPLADGEDKRTMRSTDAYLRALPLFVAAKLLKQSLPGVLRLLLH